MKRLLVLAVIFVGCLFLLDIILGQDPQRRNLEFLPDMVSSFAYKAESPNPHFASGTTQQNPVPGTIARGFRPLQYGDSVEEGIRAGRELQSPYDEENPANSELGEQLYKTYCQVCHGAGGLGDGPVTRRGYPPPASLLLDNARNMMDGQMFHIISKGYKNMPSYGAQIEHGQRWHIVAYVRQLQASQP